MAVVVEHTDLVLLLPLEVDGRIVKVRETCRAVESQHIPRQARGGGGIAHHGRWCQWQQHVGEVWVQEVVRVIVGDLQGGTVVVARGGLVRMITLRLPVPQEVPSSIA